MAKKQGKVTNTIPNVPRTVLNEKHPLVESGIVSFDFTYKDWLKAIKKKEFTNYLVDDSHFAEFVVQVFTKIIPTVQRNWEIIKHNGGAAKKQFPHCHTISPEKISLVREIVEELHGKKLCDDVTSDDLNYWQLGIDRSLRIICIYSPVTNKMFPVLLDYHHQIHPSTHHNQKDIDAYGYCPVQVYT